MPQRLPWIMFALLMILWIDAHASATASVSWQVRAFLEGLDAGDPAEISGRNLIAGDALIGVYRTNGHTPLWTEGGPLAGRTAELLNAIIDSEAHGFRAERYHLLQIRKLLEQKQEQSLALELLLTDAFLAQALHRGSGTISPPNIDSTWELPRAEIDPASYLLNTVSQRKPVRAALAQLWPTAEEYHRLVKKRAEILSSGELSTVPVPTGPVMKRGVSSERVALLKHRLKGPGEYSPEFDEDLQSHVRAFQRSSGLEPDGIVGPNTLEIMNATRGSWVERLDANLERWRWLPRTTPDTYIRVNIASFRLRAIANGRTDLAMNVIVGRSYRQTPVFTETIKYMVINPYWNVPYSIATKDKLPLLQKDAAAEAARGFEVKPQGSDSFMSVDGINWNNVTARNFSYLLRQKPGPQNALGKVKFMLPNPHSVYLHDTPTRDLFAAQERQFSSGCVRLAEPLQLARWLLDQENNAKAANLENLFNSDSSTTIYLARPMPTYIVYFTAFVDDNDEVVFRRDIYDRDPILVGAISTQRGQD